MGIWGRHSQWDPGGNAPGQRVKE